MNTDRFTGRVIKETSAMVLQRVRIVLMDTREVMISMDFVSELDNMATKKYGNYEKKMERRLCQVQIILSNNSKAVFILVP